MVKQEISNKDVENLLDDADYLQDEAEAMKYVIDSVPYDESPPDGMSILEMLQLIDHAQVSYFRPVVENVLLENRLQKLSEYEHYSDSFETLENNKKEKPDVQKTLNRIIKHRAALLNIFDNISLIDWERKLRDDSGEEIYLYEFANRLIRDERKILREIADLVMIYQNEKQHQREINRKASDRNK